MSGVKADITTSYFTTIKSVVNSFLKITIVSSPIESKL